MVSYIQMRRVTNTTNLFELTEYYIRSSILRHLLKSKTSIYVLTKIWLHHEVNDWGPLIFFFFSKKHLFSFTLKKSTNALFSKKKINLRIPKNIYIWIVFHLLFIFQGHLVGNSESFIFIIFIWICDSRVSNYKTTKNISKHLVPRFFVFQFMYIL